MSKLFITASLLLIGFIAAVHLPDPSRWPLWKLAEQDKDQDPYVKQKAEEKKAA